MGFLSYDFYCAQESSTHGVRLLLSLHNLYLKICVMQSQYHRGVYLVSAEEYILFGDFVKSDL